MASALLRLPQVMARVGLKQTRLYQLVGDGEFPAPVRLGDRAIAWVEEEVDEWIRKKAANPRVRILTRTPVRSQKNEPVAA
jgi:prophage regulatory protein